MESAADYTHSASGRVRREVSVKEPDPLKRQLLVPCACLFADQPALRNPQTAGERASKAPSAGFPGWVFVLEFTRNQKINSLPTNSYMLPTN